MTLLYPSFLWLLLPLTLFLWKGTSSIIQRIHLIVLMLIVISLARPVQEQALQEASIKAKDIRLNPILKDKNPSKIALEGTEPQDNMWPTYDDHFESKNDFQIYPGEGKKLFKD